MSNLSKLIDYRRKFSDDYIVNHTIVPVGKQPKVIGWSGPARSGTTALLYLLASSSEIDRAYFQPQKTLMRQGGPDFELFAKDKLVCMKEVFGGDDGDTSSSHDPVDLLIRAGVQPENITWITTLREPVQAFSSLLNHEPDTVPQVYVDAQRWSLTLFKKYQHSRVKTIPFVYELAERNEEMALKALFKKCGLQFYADGKFDPEAIKRKVVPGQLEDQLYFKVHIQDTFERSKYMYSKNNYSLPSNFREDIEKQCTEEYKKFYELAKRELEL